MPSKLSGSSPVVSCSVLAVLAGKAEPGADHALLAVWRSGNGGRHLAYCMHDLTGLITFWLEAGEDIRQTSGVFEAVIHAIAISCQGWPVGIEFW